MTDHKIKHDPPITHTAEPWICHSGMIWKRPPGWPNGPVLEVGSGDSIAHICEMDGGDFERDEADAKRICACVNACRGLDNPENDIEAMIQSLYSLVDIAESLGKHKEAGALSRKLKEMKRSRNHDQDGN